jgi:CRISPR type III-A-associated RAMP protein Csm4
MQSGFLVELRPLGPCRFGDGEKLRTDRIFHSDSLYSALTLAMRELGYLNDWLEATALTPQPALALSSCFPFERNVYYVPPPANRWPPPPSPRVRWKSARFAPLDCVSSLLRGEPLDDQQWVVDPASACLLRFDPNVVQAGGPFRLTRRTGIAVDRLAEGVIERYSVACLEFTDEAGLWCFCQFATQSAAAAWRQKLESAFRLLCDSGIGGERSKGWGRFEPPCFRDLPPLLQGAGDTGRWWLLSLYWPAPEDPIDWTQGSYRTTLRNGRIHASGASKPVDRMIEEGSVLVAPHLTGAVRNVAPEGFPHPVYRSGIAAAISLPGEPAA